jgi:hypothetical protein
MPYCINKQLREIIITSSQRRVTRLLGGGGYNNVAFMRDLTSGPGSATARHTTVDCLM